MPFIAAALVNMLTDAWELVKGISQELTSIVEIVTLGCPAFVLTDFCPYRYTPRQIALLPGDAQHLVVVEADHNEFNQTESEVRGAV